MSQLLLIATFLPLCWLGMMIVHELGHVMGAWVTGSTVSKVVLHPLELSRTELSLNRAPLFVVWAGPTFGALLPLLFCVGGKYAKKSESFLLRCFCGFCLVANGVYIGTGAFTKIGDAGDMLANGSSTWQLILFGLLTVPVGLAIWNGLGQHFGFGNGGEAVSPKAAKVSTILLVVVVLLEIALSGR